MIRNTYFKKEIFEKAAHKKGINLEYKNHTWQNEDEEKLVLEYSYGKKLNKKKEKKNKFLQKIKMKRKNNNNKLKYFDK